MTTNPNKPGVRPIPKGYHAVTPWIISRNTAQLLDFMKAAFGAEELASITRMARRLDTLRLASATRC